MRHALLVPCVMLLVAPPAVAQCGLTKLVSFDATLSSGKIVVDLVVDDQHVSAMLDTGSPNNLISKALVDKLNLPTERVREGAMMDAAGEPIKHLARAHTISLGEINAKGTPFFVLGESSTTESPLEVVLGTDFLEANDLELDLAHGKVNIFLPDHCPGKVVYWAHEFIPIPIKLLNGGHIILPVTLDGLETHAMLDTGAGRTFVSNRLIASALNYDPAAHGDKPAGYATAATGARMPFYRHIFDSLDIGGIQFHHTELAIAPDKANWIMNNAVHDPQGALQYDETINTPMTLGMTHIQKLQLYFAFREQMLYVTPANAN